MGSLDADIVFSQRARTRPVEPRDQAQQRGLAAAGGPQQRNELAGFDAETDVVQNRQFGAVDVKRMAHALDVERGTDGPIGDQFDNSLHYHLTTPFCQTSRRSRTLNSSVMAPEHNSDITMSAAYMLA